MSLWRDFGDKLMPSFRFLLETETNGFTEEEESGILLCSFSAECFLTFPLTLSALMVGELNTLMTPAYAIPRQKSSI